MPHREPAANAPRIISKTAAGSSLAGGRITSPTRPQPAVKPQTPAVPQAPKPPAAPKPPQLPDVFSGFGQALQKNPMMAQSIGSITRNNPMAGAAVGASMINADYMRNVFGIGGKSIPPAARAASQSARGAGQLFGRVAPQQTPQQPSLQDASLPAAATSLGMDAFFNGAAIRNMLRGVPVASAGTFGGKVLPGIGLGLEAAQTGYWLASPEKRLAHRLLTTPGGDRSYAQAVANAYTGTGAIANVLEAGGGLYDIAKEKINKRIFDLTQQPKIDQRVQSRFSSFTDPNNPASVPSKLGRGEYLNIADVTNVLRFGRESGTRPDPRLVQQVLANAQDPNNPHFRGWSAQDVAQLQN